jgi:serine/threonine protein kinase
VRQLANSYHELLEYVPPSPDHVGRRQALMCFDLQRVLVERPADGRKLLVGTLNWQRIVRKGLFGYTQTYEWLEGMRRIERCCWTFDWANRAWQVVLKSANKDDSNLAREIHHHRQFLHPHIARLYEVIVTENLVWLVLEYCPGRVDCVVLEIGS